MSATAEAGTDMELLRLVRRWLIAQAARARTEGRETIEIPVQDAIAAIVAIDEARESCAGVLDALRHEVEHVERVAHTMAEIHRVQRLITGLETDDTARRATNV